MRLYICELRFIEYGALNNCSSPLSMAGPTRKNVLLMHQKQECDMMGFIGLKNAGAKLEFK